MKEGEPAKLFRYWKKRRKKEEKIVRSRRKNGILQKGKRYGIIYRSTIIKGKGNSR